MVIKGNLQERIFENWTKMFQEGVNWLESEKKEFSSKNSRFKFWVFFNTLKEKYYKDKAAEKYSKDASPFRTTLEQKDKYICYEHLIIRPTMTPMSGGHIIIITEEVRPEILLKDFLVLHKMSVNTDYTIVVNLRKSGASVPSHFHAQGQLLEYPVTSSKYGAEFEKIHSDKEVQLDRLIYPAYGLRIKTKDIGKLEKLGMCLERCQLEHPFNLLMPKGDIFIYPRSNETSSLFGGWYTGVQEMGGLFCAKTRQISDALNYEICERILKETTYSEKDQRKKFEELIMGALYD